MKFNISRRALTMIFVVDALVAIILMQQAIISRLTVETKKSPPIIQTYGQYAVTMKWPDNLDDDVDLYVRDPAGNIVFFGNVTAGLMHLEHDDLGEINDVQRWLGKKTEVGYNYERTVLRGYQPGEYTVNVHMYRQGTPGEPIRIVVQFWNLRGDDRLVYQTVVVLKDKQEATAFRFTINPDGSITNINHLPRDFVQDAGAQEKPSENNNFAIPPGPTPGYGAP